MQHLTDNTVFFVIQKSCHCFSCLQNWGKGVIILVLSRANYTPASANKKHTHAKFLTQDSQIYYRVWFVTFPKQLETYYYKKSNAYLNLFFTKTAWTFTNNEFQKAIQIKSDTLISYTYLGNHRYRMKSVESINNNEAFSSSTINTYAKKQYDHILPPSNGHTCTHAHTHTNKRTPMTYKTFFINFKTTIPRPLKLTFRTRAALFFHSWNDTIYRDKEITKDLLP